MLMVKIDDYLFPPDSEESRTPALLHHHVSVATKQHCTIGQIHLTSCYGMKVKHQPSRQRGSCKWPRNINEKTQVIQS